MTPDRSSGGAATAAGAPVLFLALVRRDLAVAWRELPSAVAQMILQPVFLLFVFGRVLPQLGYARPGYVAVLFPGIVGLTVVLTALQTTALSLVLDFSYTMEIEDRLLAPLPTAAVAIEKMVFAALRALVATAVMFPVGALMLGGIPGSVRAVPLTVVVVTLGALVGAAAGMALGTAIPPQRIRMMFSLVVTPLIFTGSSQYPWPALAPLRWFQVVAACNPMTYVSEGLRAALAPGVPHLDPRWCVAILVASLVVLGLLAVRGFDRRAVL